MKDIQFIPSVYAHAAKLIDRSPWEVSHSADLLLQAHAKAYELYGHSPVVVGIDIYNLEAEAYGSVVNKPSGNGIPAVSDYVCSEVSRIPRLIPFDSRRDGRIPMVINVGKHLAEKLPEADIRIPVSGPFSIASNLVLFESLLLSVVENPELVLDVLCFLVEGQLALCREIVSQGLDVAFFESAASPPLISPELFEKVELPALKTMIEKAADIVGHPVPCIIGGDTATILDHILRTGTEYVICPAQTDQVLYMKKMKPYPEVMVRINMQSSTLVSQDLETVYREIDRIFELANGREKVCIGTGALPYETDPAKVLKAKEYVVKKCRENV